MIKFTSIVVVYDEELHLDECLRSLDFCDENIVILIGPSEKCLSIANAHGHTVYRHERVEIVEHIKEWAVSKAKNDWIVFIDPDEVFPADCVQDISSFIKGEEKLGEIRFPMDYYFIGYKIKHGRWSNNSRGIFDKNHMKFSSTLHQGSRLDTGYKSCFFNNFTVKHYWINSMEEFFEKHNRYLKFEGGRRYNAGDRYNIFSMYVDLAKKFIRYYIQQKGFLDLGVGWQLLKLALWYDKNTWLSLKEYQHNLTD